MVQDSHDSLGSYSDSQVRFALLALALDLLNNYALSKSIYLSLFITKLTEQGKISRRPIPTIRRQVTIGETSCDTVELDA